MQTDPQKNATKQLHETPSDKSHQYRNSNSNSKFNPPIDSSKSASYDPSETNEQTRIDINTYLQDIDEDQQQLVSDSDDEGQIIQSRSRVQCLRGEICKKCQNGTSSFDKVSSKKANSQSQIQQVLGSTKHLITNIEDQSMLELPRNQPSQKAQKTRMPVAFRKAKRTLTRLCENYLKSLKQEYLKHGGVIRFYSSQRRIVRKAINQMVKIHPNKREADRKLASLFGRSIGRNKLDYKVCNGIGNNTNNYQKDSFTHQSKNKNTIPDKQIQKEQQSKNPLSKAKLLIKNQQTHHTLYYYIPDSNCVLSYNPQSNTRIIPVQRTFNFQIIDPQDTKPKLPDYATPIPFKDAIYFLDAMNFNNKDNMYASTSDYNLKIDLKLKKVCKISPGPIMQRVNCGITKDDQYIYLVGGYAGKYNLPVKTCQRFNPIISKFELLPNTQKVHTSPSTCISNSKLYVFSNSGIEMLEIYSYPSYDWLQIPLPYNCEIHPFQYAYPVSPFQIMIFGGVFNNRNQSTIQIFNTQNYTIENKGDILPQPMSSQRCSMPVLWFQQSQSLKQNNKPNRKEHSSIQKYTYNEQSHRFLMVLGSVQASVYKEVMLREDFVNVFYISSEFCFLKELVFTKQCKEKEQQENQKQRYENLQARRCSNNQQIYDRNQAKR